MEYNIALAGCMFFLFAAFGKKIYRCWVNPITVFCGVWGGILFAYSFHAYELYYASNESLWIIICGVIMFFIGALIATFIHTQKGNISRETSIIIDAEPFNYGMLLFLNILSFLFLIGFGLTVFRQLISGSNFYYIHKMYNDEEGLIASSTTYKNIVTWFVWPLMHVSLVALPVILFRSNHSDKNPQKKWSIILILSNLILFCLVSGKRGFFLNFIVYSFSVYFLQGKKILLKRKTKIGIAISIIFAILAIDYLSTSRGSTSIIRTIYIYLVGCIPHLSSKLENNTIELTGISSIYGFFQAPIIIVSSIIRLPLLSSIRSSMSELHAYTQTRAFIGPGMTFNAFLSPFFFFYMDGGWICNILFSLTFGYASICVYHKHLRVRSYKSMIVYVLILFSLIMSFVRIQFFQMRYVLSFFYVYLIFKNVNIRFRIKLRKSHET